MKKSELKHLIKSIITEEQNLHTGDVVKTSEYNKWKDVLKSSVLHLQKLIPDKFKLLNITSYDPIKGPYAVIRYANNPISDKIWTVDDKDALRIESKKWVGTIDQLAKAFNGDQNMIKLVMKQGAEEILLNNV